MRGHLTKRSFTLAGHRTSVALEPAFWAALEAEATRRGATLARLVATTDAARGDPELPLASALRVLALGAVVAGRTDVGGCGAGGPGGRALPALPPGA